MSATATKMCGFAALLILCGMAAILSACQGQGESASAPTDTQQGPRLTATCDYSHTSEADPIFKPSSHPPAHLHDFFGNTTTNQKSTYSSLRNGGAKCKQSADKSAWWATAVYAGNTKLKVSKMLIYYQTTPKLDQSLIHTFPANFKDISRSPMWRCGDGEFRRAFGKCDADEIEVRLFFQPCYNPKSPTAIETNTTNPVQGKCPKTHPVLLPRILAQATYHLPSGAHSNFSVPGNTGDHLAMTNYHVDFINAWNQNSLKQLVSRCLKETTVKETRPEECRKG